MALALAMVGDVWAPPTKPDVGPSAVFRLLNDRRWFRKVERAAKGDRRLLEIASF
jgi:hypothetical protein